MHLLVLHSCKSFGLVFGVAFCSNYGMFLFFDGCPFPFLHLPASHFNTDLDDSDTVDGTVKCGTKNGNYTCMCHIFTSIGEYLGLPGPRKDQTGKSLYFSRNALAYIVYRIPIVITVSNLVRFRL